MALGVAVRHDRVAAEEEQQRRALVVPHGGEARPSADQFGHQRLARGVDGGGGVALPAASDRTEPLGGSPTGGVESGTAGQVHGDGVGPDRGLGVGDAGGDVVEHLRPRGGAPVRAPTHERLVQPTGVVVQRSQGPSLRAGVTPGEGVVVVAPHPDHLLVVGDGDDNAAHGVADPAERAHLRGAIARVAPAAHDVALLRARRSPSTQQVSHGRPNGDRVIAVPSTQHISWPGGHPWSSGSSSRCRCTAPTRTTRPRSSRRCTSTSTPSCRPTSTTSSTAG